MSDDKDVTISELKHLLLRVLKVVPKDHEYQQQVVDYLRRKRLTTPFRGGEA